MVLPASLLAVAGHDCPPEVCNALATYGLAPVPSGTDPGRLRLDAASVRKLPASEAEAKVPYLADEVLTELFRADRRKGVRMAITRQAHRLEAVCALEVIEWLQGDVSVSHRNHVDFGALLERLSVTQLIGLADSPSSHLARTAGHWLARRVGGREQLDEALAAVSGPARDEILGAVLSGRVEGVAPDEGIALAGDRLTAALPRTTAATPTVLALALADHEAPHRMPFRSMSFDEQSVATLRSAMADRPREALEIWRLLGLDIVEGIAALGDALGDAVDSLETLGMAELRPVLREVDPEVHPEVHRHLWRRCAALAATDGTAARLLAEQCPDVAVLREALASLDDETSAWLAAELCQRVVRVKSLAPLAGTLLMSGAPASVRARLVDADSDQQAALAVARDLLEELGGRAQYGYNAAEQAERLLGLVPMPEPLCAELVAGAIGHCEAWLVSGTTANPATEAVLVDVARRTAHLAMLANPLARRDSGIPGPVLDVLVERTEDANMVRTLVDVACLAPHHVEDLLDRVPGAVDVVLRGGRGTSATYGTRDAVVRAGGWDSHLMARSLVELAPRADERYLVAMSLTTERGAQYLLGHLPLERHELVAALLKAPRDLDSWLMGSLPTPYDEGVLIEVLGQDDSVLGHAYVSTWQHLLVHLADVEEARPLLLGRTEPLGALRAAARALYTGRPIPREVGALRAGLSLCRTVIGDDAVAWAQLAAQLDDWKGTLGELLAVCRAVAR